MLGKIAVLIFIGTLFVTAEGLTADNTEEIRIFSASSAVRSGRDYFSERSGFWLRD
jgi:hypothetical protein